MKKAFVIILCKILTVIGKMINKGSSLPGKIALKIYPNILSDVKLCKNVVAVTGSNGKTSTVELIAHILNDCGFKVAYNKEGSNQIEGVTTLILNNSNLKGEVKADVLVIESDERFARYTFSHFNPTHYVITNLYRDQLSRNGHSEMVYDCIKDSIKSKDTTLILNADDPLVSLFGKDRDNTIYFGMDKTSSSSLQNTSIYNDGTFCPNCKGEMNYDYYHYAHIGAFECKNCGHKKRNTSFTVTNLDLEKGLATINNKYEISLFLKSIYNVYNSLAAFSLASLLGANEEKVAKSISNYILKNGRLTLFKLGERKGVLLTSKHENSVSYNQSIELARNAKDEVSVVIIVDAISRKYFTGEISWLWDIDFEKLDSQNIKEIILCGKYCYDLKNRFEYTGLKESKIKMVYDTQKLPDALKDEGGDIIVITCFSDRDKLLKYTEKLNPNEHKLPF